MKKNKSATLTISLFILAVCFGIAVFPLLFKNAAVTALAGNGCTYTISPGDSLSNVISQLGPGETLCLEDGTYYQSLSVSKSGTESQPITIRAVNDGKVTIDGQNSRQPANVSGNYIIIGGIVFQNSSGEVVGVGGNHNVLRRCSAYNANPDGNYHRFTVTGDYNLLEDCAAGGTGRYGVDVYEASYNILRRFYVKWGGHNSGSPRAAFAVYGSDHSILENCIGTDVYPHPGYTAQNEYAGIYHEMASWNQDHGAYNNNNRYLGCIVYRNLTGGITVSDMAGPNMEFENCVFFDHNRTHSLDTNGGHGIGAKGTHEGMTIKNCSFINNSQTAIWYSGTQPVVNTIFMNNGEAFLDSKNDYHQYCDFYGNNRLGTTINSTDLQVDPKFGQNYLYIPKDSPLKSKGNDGADIGANVIYRYKDGALSNESLWPWPMEERICNEIGVSVTWKNSNQTSQKTGQKCGGGFWDTLDGIYSGQTPQPCSSQGGDICQSNETCSGSWLSASDSDLQPPH